MQCKDWVRFNSLDQTERREKQKLQQMSEKVSFTVCRRNSQNKSAPLDE
jgi:hypothetical protein